VVIFEREVNGIREEALARFVLRARKAAGLHGRVNVLVTGSAEMRKLNKQFRAKNKPTDVLSFPAELCIQRKEKFAGEIAISGEIASRNAARFGHSAALEIKVLVLHGILHLAGFDHERDNGQMARKEATLRKALHLPAALIERSAGSRKGRRPR
jgi:probable rRNA maturation factor